MFRIQQINPIYLQRGGVLFITSLPVISVAIAVIGITSILLGNLNAIAQLGLEANCLVLGMSVFVCIFDLVIFSHIKLPSPQTEGPSFNEEEGIDFVKEFPEEISLKVFYYLDVKTLGRCSFVSQDWRRIVLQDSLWNLRDHFPSLKVFDEKSWKQFIDLEHFRMEVDDIPPLNQRAVIPFLLQMEKLSIENNKGITFLTMPKGLTLGKLNEIAHLGTQEGVIRYIFPQVLSHFKDLAVENTFRLFITNNILEGSRDKYFHTQSGLVEQHGCEISGFLELATLLVISSQCYEERLYSTLPWTHARCQETIEGSRLIVGGFAKTGFAIFYSGINSSSFNYGVSAMLIT